MDVNISQENINIDVSASDNINVSTTTENINIDVNATSSISVDVSDAQPINVDILGFSK